MTTTGGTTGKADRQRALKIALGVSGSFTALVGLVVWLLVSGRVTYQLALLMLVAMLGLYVGLGVLFAVYRFIDKLE